LLLPIINKWFLFSWTQMPSCHGCTVACCTAASWLQSISLPILAKEWSCPAGGRRLDVVAAGTTIVRKRISRLAELLKAGHVVVQVRHLISFKLY
jgi:hypothetical protein